MSKKRSQNKSPPSSKSSKKKNKASKVSPPNVSSSLSNVDNPPSSSSASSSSVSLSLSTHPSLSTKLITNSTTPIKKVKKVKKVIPSSSSSSPSKPSNDIDNISNSSDFSLEFPTSSTLLIYPNVSNYSTITSSSSNNDDEFDYDYYDNLPQHEDYDDDEIISIDDSDETISIDKSDSTKLSDGILNLYRSLGWCKNPPKPSSVFVDENKENQRRVANIYIPYLKALYNDFPNAFTPIHVENLTLYENILSNNLPFEYECLFNVVKNISYRITKSDEQRQRDNETNVARVERKRLAGYCSCNEPVCVNNKAKCQTCSDKEANRAIESYRAAKAKGWCGYCKKPFNQDGTCSQCANNLVNRKLKRCKNTISFNAAVEKHGIEWFKEEETLELLCRSCHAVEHASTTNSDSTLADLHWQVVELFDCACSGCGLSYCDDDQFEDMEELKKMFHIHHVHVDGAERRRQAGNAYNEFQIILDSDDNELKDYRCLCDPCHYWEHIDKNVKSEIIRLGLEEEIKAKLWGNMIKRPLQ